MRQINSSANTAIEEAGTNLLHLAFGFLEWTESDDSQAVRVAPLILMPASLRKVTRPNDSCYRYYLSYSEEDLNSNLSLREKLRADFNLELPELEVGELPEAYFSKMSEILKGKSRWRLRRYVTLSLFHFGKLLMYLDLDPGRWPPESSIERHPLLRNR